MILWLASYPESGNNFLGSLLSSYFFSRDGSFNSDSSNHINQFPSKEIFNQIGVNLEDKYNVAKNYIKAQQAINRENTLKFYKTNSSFCKMYNDFNFSDLKNSIGVIYVVRDPRHLVSSFVGDNNKNIEDAVELLINEKTILNEKDKPEVYLGSWSFNYNSWKIYQPSKKYLLIKYEHLLNDTKNSLIQMLNFINSLGSAQFPIHDDKIFNLIKTIKFPNIEDHIDEKLNLKMLSKIENKFKKEMIELGYL